MLIKSKNLQETLKLGKRVSQQLKGGEILKLEGQLGAGKTAFVKGLALGLGIKKPVRSPTFNLIKIYNLKNKLVKQLIHVDCYRLKNEAEIIELGLLDYLNQPNVVVAIEWSQKIKIILKKYKTKKLSFKIIDENQRLIQI
ncbi:MAG TPA: tRNA (adenosine(37)-N6)-threonylcarbamoyltransferase complex ATPase subunit type 1 TsaE [Candidatus Magasanikbacteria bacterium]|nr:tRNA (adenosine(37)-N6)-threonylcarbamoyltransferase complex ATPase subunit type 1 TsaE [Candidatus Magasanikbacteria bacterium]